MSLRGLIRTYANATGVILGTTNHFVGANVKRLPRAVRLELVAVAGRRTLVTRAVARSNARHEP